MSALGYYVLKLVVSGYTIPKTSPIDLAEKKAFENDSKLGMQY